MSMFGLAKASSWLNTLLWFAITVPPFGKRWDVQLFEDSEVCNGFHGKDVIAQSA